MPEITFIDVLTDMRRLRAHCKHVSPVILRKALAVMESELEVRKSDEQRAERAIRLYLAELQSVGLTLSDVIK